MGLCGSGTKETPGAVQERKQLEEKLREDHVDDVSVHKLLLLGPGESGKSTLFKQMITIYGHGFSEKDRKSYIPLIHRNLVACIDELAKQSVELPKQDRALGNCKVVDSNAQKSLQFILDLKYEGVMSSEILKNVKTLWEEPGLQNTYNNRSKFQLNDSAIYFLNKVDELAKSNYLPSDQDIIMCRVRTTGIIENDFIIDNNRFKLVDVGGQRNERKKWLHCFEKVTAVLFVVDIGAYDCKLYEDEKVNRLEEALNLFEETCNLKWFRTTSFILFLNKCDIFKEKVKKVPLTVTFPEYTGENTYDAGIAFLEQEFLKRNHQKKPVYCHVTCVADTRLVSAVFNGVKDIVVREALQSSGILM